MKSNIKEEILRHAKLLFNQQGYDAVSMRDIARAAGISVGNLTYHFPRKTDILLALLSLSRNPGLHTIEVHTLADLDKLIRNLLLSVVDYAFYFQNIGHFMADEELKQNESISSDAIEQNFLQGLERLRTEEYFLPTFTPELAHTLGNFLLLSHYSWAQYMILSGAEQRSAIDAFTRDHWLVLSPYFSEKGRKEFAQLQAQLSEPV